MMIRDPMKCKSPFAIKKCERSKCKYYVRSNSTGTFCCYEYVQELNKNKQNVIILGDDPSSKKPKLSEFYTNSNKGATTL